MAAFIEIITDLNFGSLVCGVTAWVLPLINLVGRVQAESKRWILFSMASVSACALSIYMQLAYQKYLSDIEDWSAIMDTSNASVFLSSVLLIVTILLNIAVLVKYVWRSKA